MPSRAQAALSTPKSPLPEALRQALRQSHEGQSPCQWPSGLPKMAQSQRAAGGWSASSKKGIDRLRGYHARSSQDALCHAEENALSAQSLPERRPHKRPLRLPSAWAN